MQWLSSIIGFILTNHVVVVVVSLSVNTEKVAPKVPMSRIKHVSDTITHVLTQLQGSPVDRYASARDVVAQQIKDDSFQAHELVYGELSVEVLAELLDAVGVHPGDCFLDIGSGDGALVLGAALLYPDHLRVSRGIELVPGLYERSLRHAQQVETSVPVEFHCGNIYHQTSSRMAVLHDTTLAVCFATTWSAESLKLKQGRRLPELSRACSVVPRGGRILIVDGRLSERDGYRWEGDMKIQCPDTAPYSIASLYERI